MQNIGKLFVIVFPNAVCLLYCSTKTLPDEKETVNNTVKSEVNEGTQEKSEVLSTDTPLNNSELNKIDSVLNKNINENDNTVNKDILQSSLEVVDFPQKDMETVWNKDVDVTNTLFPNSQSLVTQKVEEQEVNNMSVTESIVTVQLEQLRLNEEENNKSDESRNEWYVADQFKNLFFLL